MCLPVFLAGCKQLYLFCGPTFLERLWCLLEIFVYLEMGGRVDDVTLVLAPPEGIGEVDAYFEERFQINRSRPAASSPFRLLERFPVLYP